jgi:ribosomal protein L7/L12
MKQQKQKYYLLTNSEKTQFYSVLKSGGELIHLKIVKRGRFALAYNLKEAKDYKAWLQKKENIFSMLIPK